MNTYASQVDDPLAELLGVAKGVVAMPATVRLCAHDATGAERALLVMRQVPSGTTEGFLENITGIGTPLIVGFGLLPLSRVLAQAVPMRHELDATV